MDAYTDQRDNIPLRKRSATFVDEPAGPKPIAEVVGVSLLSDELTAIKNEAALALLNCLIVKLLGSSGNDSAAVECEEELPLSPSERRVSEIGPHLMDNAHLARRFSLKQSPEMSATAYLERINQYCQYSASVYLSACHYIYKLVIQWGVIVLTELNVHRLLISALRVGCKIVEDITHTQTFTAKIGGVSGKDFLMLEITLLFLLKFECHVDQKVLENTIVTVKEWLGKQ